MPEAMFWGCGLRMFMTRVRLHKAERETETRRRELMLAVVARAAANSYHFTRSDQKPWEVEDFLPRYRNPRVTSKDMEALAAGLAAHYGASIKGKTMIGGSAEQKAAALERARKAARMVKE